MHNLNDAGVKVNRQATHQLTCGVKVAKWLRKPQRMKHP